MKTLTIAPFTAADRAGWEALARGYKAFYKTETRDDEYERAWQRLLAQDVVHGLGAWRTGDGALVGLSHHLFHTSTWTDSARSHCYLQDLYTAPTARGQGVARALIAAVADAARAAGATRFYWLTQENNAVARVLYEQVAQYQGFIRYDHPL